MSELAIKCRGCTLPIPADDVDIKSGLAKCRSCNAVFPFGDQVDRKAKPERPPVPMPRNIVVTKGPHALSILRKWKWSAIGGFFLVFALFWNSIVSVFVFLAASGAEFKGDDGTPASPTFLWVFLTPFIMVGLGTGYGALGLLLNRTYIHVDKKSLTVRHRPMPWPGRHTLDATRINQLYCSQYVGHQSNGVPQYRMCVMALMADGARIELIKGLEDVGQAFYLEELIERHLQIANRPIQEEYKRSHLE